MRNKDLESLLITKGLVTQEQLDACKKEAVEQGISLEECLVNKGLVNPEALAQIYAEQSGLQYFEALTEDMADPLLLARVPLKFLRDNHVIPVKVDGDLVFVAAVPYNFRPLDDLALIFGSPNRVAVASSKVIVDSINRFYPLEGTKEMLEELEEEQSVGDEVIDFDEITETDILGMASEAPVIKLVNHILYQAVKRGASDIHVEPFEKEVRIRYRIDGVMYTVETPPKRVQAALISRIKIMSNLNIAEKRKPQDGRIQIKVADKSIDIRVSIIPVTFGERVVMRLLDKTRAFLDIEQLGFSERDLGIVKKCIERSNGIFFVSGPTGSGKTSTLYSILNRLNSTEVNIMTVEDPVEYQMTGVAQIQVKEKIGLTFAAALRSILRQDPDIIMVGETRDQETAQISIQAALTGHLVLSTIHTNNAPATITRLLDMGIEPFLIASTVVAIVAQRLVRQLCNDCKQAYKPEAAQIKQLRLTDAEAAQITFYQPVGCHECEETGYKGRFAIFEVMEMTPAVAQLTMQQADAIAIRKQALADGMVLLITHGLENIKEGKTTIDEVLAVANMEGDIDV
ncbi:Flp pilus assembly complex ATPase component TadA [Candidatus Babeliales bacterium]|nr:Flp pilus assembly complex ATPase component TadA [Candidatus Babeliales bacterium]